MKKILGSRKFLDLPVDARNGKNFYIALNGERQHLPLRMENAVRLTLCGVHTLARNKHGRQGFLSPLLARILTPSCRNNAGLNVQKHFRKKAHIKSLEDYDRISSLIGRASRKALGRHRGGVALVQEVGQGFGMEQPLGQAVCRLDHISSYNCSRSPRANLEKEQSRADLGGRTGRRVRTLTLTRNWIAKAKSSPTC